MMVNLGQLKPGEWSLFHSPFTGEPDFEPIPVPSWAVERHMDELEYFAWLLWLIFRKGIEQGKKEGIESAQLEMRKACGVIA